MAEVAINTDSHCHPGNGAAHGRADGNLVGSRADRFIDDLANSGGKFYNHTRQIALGLISPIFLVMRSH